jgi:hypothetical protein
VWVEILQPAKNFLARAQPEILFLAILHYKPHERPTQARDRPEPGPKFEARRVQWDGRGQNFSTRNIWVFSVRPAKCSPFANIHITIINRDLQCEIPSHKESNILERSSLYTCLQTMAQISSRRKTTWKNVLFFFSIWFENATSGREQASSPG